MGGGPTCTTRTSPLMQRKKKREAQQSILYYSIHRDEGVQEAEVGGGGGLFKRCMGGERNGEIYATMLSISQQQKECVAVM